MNPDEPTKLDWVRRLQDLGRIEERLRVLLNDNIFEYLSKHDPYWNENDSDEYDRLDECRMKFRHIQDQLYEVLEIAHGDHQ